MASETPYELIYWPGIPGRAEHIRLCFEEAGVPYIDHSTEASIAIPKVTELISPDNNFGDEHNPPGLAPPFLRHGNVLLSQTPNILQYLAPKLGLGVGSDSSTSEIGTFHLNQLVLTALDGLSDETHDTHHPISVGLYYEDQKPECLKRAQHYREERLPKFLGYFERVLRAKTSGEGPWLYGGKLTYADLVLFQCIDGVLFAFPKAMANIRSSGKYDRVLALHAAVKERPNIKAYVESGRRKEYGMGIYRYYPELDD